MAISQQTPLIPGIWVAGAVAASAVLVVLMMLGCGLHFAPLDTGSGILLAMLGGAVAVRYALRGAVSQGQCALRDFCEYVFLFMAISILGVIASYLEAKLSTGFADASLHRIDLMLHFDWVAWYRFVVDHPSLQRLGSAAYDSIYFSPALISGYFAWTGRRAEARQFLAAFWLAATVCLILYPLFPATGPLSFLWKGDIPYMPTSALYQQEMIPALRDGGLALIDLGAMRGLVCAPSFHTVCATLYILTAWPIARLRWIILALNIAMLLSVPVEGTHYLTDMIAGFAVAVAAAAVIRLALPRLLASGHQRWKRVALPPMG